MQHPPREAGSDVADWHWKVVRRFVQERFEITLARSTCLHYLHRRGCVLKRPKTRLLKADAAQREAFVAASARLRAEAAVTGAQPVFVDEAHFYAAAVRRGQGGLKGEPALVDSTSPRYGEKASYYAAVCVETGDVEAMLLEGNSTAATSVAFLQCLRAAHPEPLVVFWDNAPAHSGDPLRAYLTTPNLRVRLVRLPAYSPDFNAVEPLWDWVRDAVTANTCFGTAANVRAHVDPFLAGLAEQKAAVRQRCRTVLQAKAQALEAVTAGTAIVQHSAPPRDAHGNLTLALV